jgi:DNA repair exonuclease SbcCD ATPase subunit
VSVDNKVQPGFEITAENIGGIDQTTLAFQPGVTVLVGRNASNRTSLLQAFMAALGSDDVSIKGDADHGEVTLDIDGDTYTRHLARDRTGMRLSGDPYLEDPETAELFAFLLESNEARQAVVGGADLRDIIMRPVDTDEINAEIAELRRERERIDGELETIEDQKGTLPTLEQRRTELANEIAATEDELRQRNEELEAFDMEVTETQAEQSELETKLETLRSTRSELEDVRYQIETQRERKEALRTERREVNERLEALDAAPEEELGEVERRIQRLTDRKASIEADLDEIRSVIEFNEEMLDGNGSEFVAALADEENEASDSVTDQLLEEGDVACWTCGSRTDQASIEGTIDRLRELNQSKFEDLEALKAELSELKEDRQRLLERREEHDRLKDELDELTSEIETADELLEERQKKREALTEEVASIEEAVESLEEDVYSDLLDVHREANELEYELDRLETERQEVTERLNELEDSIAREDDLRAQREAVQTEITDLRTKIERIETEAVDRFNESMETVLDLLEYQNLARIWIEPVERDVRTGRTKTTERAFELHVIRTTDSGATYEDSIDHFSESEREVTGLVFALAGYLAHDVSEEVPFLLLDSLEAIDSQRIAELIRYLSGYAENLIVALLPEDADALDDTYQRIVEI